METVTFKTDIEIDFSELVGDISYTLMKKAKQQYEGKCSNKFGYITEVIEISKIYDNVVSRSNPNILFKVELKVERFIPEIGKCIDATIKQILPAGIYLVHCGMNILIPKRTIENSEVKDNILKIDNKEYKVGEKMMIEIVNLKYENKKYSSIGKYISNLKK